jgi:putative DNA primase/helicase
MIGYVDGYQSQNNQRRNYKMLPDSNEFTKFHMLLIESAPAGYSPHYFRLAKHSKAPATQFGSWKDPKNRLIIKMAVRWMERGGNIGIAGMEYDPLVNIDLDGLNVRKELLKPTLTTRSRSRTGIHGFYFTKDKKSIPNIPTDNDGEVRSQGQYVVAAGSYVPTDPDTVPKEYRDTAGYYTIEDRLHPAWIISKSLHEMLLSMKEETQNHPKDGAVFSMIQKQTQT